MMQALFQRPVIEEKPFGGHSPTLDTQIMVEKTLRKNGSFPSRRALMRALPLKVEYGTLVRTLQYLEASEKILLSEDGSVVWVFVDNPKFLKLLEQSPVLKSKEHKNSPHSMASSKRLRTSKIRTSLI